MKASRLCTTLLVFILLISISYTFFVNSTHFLRNDFWKRYPGLKNMYGESQYVIKNPKGWIPDEPVNAYAGGAYVKEHVSPIIIAADTPPFGRYLIGWSALLTGNENVFIFISYIGSILLLYILGLKMYKSNTVALLPAILVSFEPLLRNQAKYVPLLDIMQLFFLLLSCYFFILGVEKKLPLKKIIVFFSLASLFLGMFISTKFYATGITVVVAWVGVLVWTRKYLHLIYLLCTLPLSVLFLLLNYVQLLFQGYSLQSFLGVQKYIFLYHKTQLIHPFTIWPLLLFNKWYVWWGNTPVLSDPQWRVSWPIVTVSVWIAAVFTFIKREKNNIPFLLCVAWSCTYILFFSFGQITARYIVILLPVMYLVFFYLLQQVWRRYNKKRS